MKALHIFFTEMQSEKELTLAQKEERKLRQVYLRFPEKFYADFLIKIRHENISFRRFFQILVDAFIRARSAGRLARLGYTKKAQQAVQNV